MPDGDFRRRLKLSREQREARSAILNWHRRGEQQVFHLAGLAGTGKTALAVEVGCELGAQFAAFSGKAASVLRERGGDSATTLHSLLYGAPSVEKDKKGEERLRWTRRSRITAKVVVADECSQIDRKVGRDLLATGAKILLTGDPAQLPPVEGRPFFNGAPDFELTEIHRQAARSEPLKLAMAIREGRSIDRPRRFDLDEVLDADVVICALNRTQRGINRRVRQDRGLPRDEPVPGDRVICYRSNHESAVLNGTIWTVALAGIDSDDVAHLELIDDIGGNTVVAVPDLCFGAEKPQKWANDRDFDCFDFAYAVTAHKAQGSEWKKIVVIDETVSPGFKYITGNVPLEEFRRRW